MERLLALLERAAAALEPYLQHKQADGPMSPQGGAASVFSVSADPSGKGQRWAKSRIFVQFKEQVVAAAAAAASDLDVLLAAVRADPTTDATIEPHGKFLLNHYMFEADVLALLAQKLAKLLAVGPDDMGAYDDRGLVQLALCWNNGVKFAWKLRVLVRFFCDMFGLAAPPSDIDPPVDDARYLSHPSASRLWQENFSSDESHASLRELCAVVTNDYDDPAVQAAVQDAAFVTMVCSMPDRVSVFRLDDMSRRAGMYGMLLRLGNVEVSRMLAELDALERASSSTGAVNDASALAASTDMALLKARAIDLDRRLSLLAEREQLAHQRNQEIVRLLDTAVDALLAGAIRDAVSRDFRTRTDAMARVKADLQEAYRRIIERHAEVAEQHAAAQREKDLVTLRPMSRVPASVAAAAGLALPMSADDRRRASDASTTADATLGYDTQLRALHVALTTHEERAKYRQENYAARFGLSPSLRLLHSCGSFYMSPAERLPLPIFVYFYEQFICFHRMVRTDIKTVIPMHNVVHIAKTTSPPFFPTAIQLVLREPAGTAFTLTHLDKRDQVFELLQFLRRTFGSHNPREKQLMELGLMAVEAVYENERTGTFRSFSPERLLPSDGRGQWSTADGARAAKTDFKLPTSNWRWVSKWAPDVSGAADADGWEYAASFAGPWGEKTSNSAVRRRQWIRKRVRLPANARITPRPTAPGQLEIYDDAERLVGYYESSAPSP